MSELVIPWQSLSDDSLIAVIEDFVTREGTDYGLREYSLDQKVGQVRGQLARGETVIVYESESGSCSLLPASELDDRESD